MVKDSALPTFEEKAEYEKGFGVYFKKEIQPLLEQIEEKRLEQRAIYLKRRTPAIIGIVGFCILVLGVSIALQSFGDWVFGVCFVVGGFIWGWASTPLRRYSSHVKGVILPKLADFYGTFKYVETPSFPRQMLDESTLFPSYDMGRSSTEDLFEGKYKDVGIQFQEITLKQKSGKQTVVTFTGLVVRLAFNKSFKGKTYVLSDRGRMGNWLQSSRGGELVTLEDPHFEKTFEVYSDDQVEARYILTTAFMERLVKLKESRESISNGKGSFQCSFMADHLYISMPSNRNLFEPKSIHESMLNPQDLHIFLAQMHQLFSIVDELKLNQKLGL